MKRKEIFNKIDAERIDQDARWRTGRPNEVQYKFSAPHVILLNKLAQKLEDEWYTSSYEDFQSRFIKIAAVAVRALEEIEVK